MGRKILITVPNQACYGGDRVKAALSDIAEILRRYNIHFEIEMDLGKTYTVNRTCEGEPEQVREPAPRALQFDMETFLRRVAKEDRKIIDRLYFGGEV